MSTVAFFYQLTDNPVLLASSMVICNVFASGWKVVDYFTPGTSGETSTWDFYCGNDYFRSIAFCTILVELGFKPTELFDYQMYIMKDLEVKSVEVRSIKWIGTNKHGTNTINLIYTPTLSPECAIMAQPASATRCYIFGSLAICPNYSLLIRELTFFSNMGYMNIDMNCRSEQCTYWTAECTNLVTANIKRLPLTAWSVDKLVNAYDSTTDEQKFINDIYDNAIYTSNVNTIQKYTNFRAATDSQSAICNTTTPLTADIHLSIYMRLKHTKILSLKWKEFMNNIEVLEDAQSNTSIDLEGYQHIATARVYERYLSMLGIVAHEVVRGQDIVVSLDKLFLGRMSCHIENWLDAPDMHKYDSIYETLTYIHDNLNYS